MNIYDQHTRYLLGKICDPLERIADALEGKAPKDTQESNSSACDMKGEPIEIGGYVSDGLAAGMVMSIKDNVVAFKWEYGTGANGMPIFNKADNLIVIPMDRWSKVL